ncbi:MAG: FkbM family methyltransferase [Saprospiraceae bacterium]|nr:FkbM family methyltransferase [Saprospiraceae bacterium]MDW8230460.1 FkbM family methyltransferase [Saprospiraceae bacterium]
MKQLLYRILSKWTKAFFKDRIVGKKVSGLDKVLYYEMAQHLTFLFQREIRYEPGLQHQIGRYLRPGAVVFDIGANIGQYALFFSEQVGEGGRVYSFEPDPRNYAFLQFNVHLNRCRNVVCCPFGIGAEDAEQPLFRDTDTGGRRSSFKKEFVGAHYHGSSETVAVKRLDGLIAAFGQPDFIKIDVEGFEEEVLRGLTVDLRDCVFLIEVREETKGGVLEYFVQRGYECLWVEGQGRKIARASEIPGFAHLIFRRPSREEGGAG